VEGRREYMEIVTIGTAKERVSREIE